MATIEPMTAGLASVHGCIGAVDPVRSFGSPEQKQHFLPRLASGQALSGFAMTSGARVIDSTPPATKRSPSPAATAWQAPTIAESPEAQSRFTVTPATESGSPARSAAIRATLRLSSPA